MVDTGCHGLPESGPRCDHNDQGGGGGSHRSWKDTLLGRGHGHGNQGDGGKATSKERQRSRSRLPRRLKSSKGHGRHGGCSSALAYPSNRPHAKPKIASQVHVPTPDASSRTPAAAPNDSNSTQDEAAEFFTAAETDLAAPSLHDAAQALLDEEVATFVAAALEFQDHVTAVKGKNKA